MLACINEYLAMGGAALVTVVAMITSRPIQSD
jgi:hypothetical protein